MDVSTSRHALAGDDALRQTVAFARRLSAGSAAPPAEPGRPLRSIFANLQADGVRGDANRYWPALPLEMREEALVPQPFGERLQADPNFMERILRDYRLACGKRRPGDPFPKSRRVVMKANPPDKPSATLDGPGNPSGVKEKSSPLPYCYHPRPTIIKGDCT